MLLHNGGDWVRKLMRLRGPTGAAQRAADAALPVRPDVRMLPFERVQHALLVISFVTLVWTGFALKYPGQWWARPLAVAGRQPCAASCIAWRRWCSWQCR